METPIRIKDYSRHRPEQESDATRYVNGFTVSYLQLCRGQGYQLTSTLEPQPGDWALGEHVPDGMELIPSPPRSLREGEVIVPTLSRLVHLLREEAYAVVIDCYPEDFACMAFDENSYSLANIVSRNPEEAALRALLFIKAERAANASS